MRQPFEANSVDPVYSTSAPPACPACRASSVTTTSKAVSAETYWRCESCGEVWNVGRRAKAAGGGSRFPWGSRY